MNSNSSTRVHAYLHAPPSQVHFRELDICVLDEALLLDVDQTLWPRCDCLIAFSSSKYPLAKVEEYAMRVKPVSINDLPMQHVLQDRRKVFRLLRENGIPLPDHVVLTDAEVAGPGEYRWDEIEERDDAICLKGGEVLLPRPFVEKPVDADDHNIRVYFREDDGGGCQVSCHTLACSTVMCSAVHPLCYAMPSRVAL